MKLRGEDPASCKISKSSKETYGLFPKTCLHNVVFPDWRGPVIATILNSPAVISASSNSRRFIIFAVVDSNNPKICRIGNNSKYAKICKIGDLAPVTIAADVEGIYVCFASYGIIFIDHEGSRKWEYPIQVPDKALSGQIHIVFGVVWFLRSVGFPLCLGYSLIIDCGANIKAKIHTLNIENIKLNWI